MIDILRDTIHYLGESNILSKDEFAKIVLKRATRRLFVASSILILAWLIGMWSTLSVNLQVVGILLDAYAGLLLTSVAARDYLEELHYYSRSPDAVAVTHTEETVTDVKRTTDHVLGLILLVTGFILQLPSAMM